MADRLKKQNCAAVVVTFNPDCRFFLRLGEISRQVNQVIIVDNGSKKEILKNIVEDCSLIGGHLISNNTNLGIGAALNIGINAASFSGYQWVILFDQDSLPVNDFIVQMEKISSDRGTGSSVAVIGSNYFSVVQGIRLQGFTPPESIGLFFENQTAITSGSIISIKAYKKIGPFREDLFIDHVDHEYCLRARSNGYFIIVSTRCLIEHTIGKAEIRKFGPFKLLCTNHCASRRYFWHRNLIILIRKYIFTEWKWCLFIIWRGILQVPTMLLEHRRGQKLLFSLLGFLDGVSGNFSRNTRIAAGCGEKTENSDCEPKVI